VILAGLAYANALRNGFVLDDVPIIVRNPLIRSLGNLPQIFATDYWAGAGGADPGLYRPLTVFSYALNYSLSGLSAAAFHATNVVLHAATTLAVFLLGAELLASAGAAFAAAAIFAVHPLHTEAVTSIVGRAEVLVTLFFVLALWIGRDRTSWRAAVGVGVLYLAALLSKESAATLPLVFLLVDWTGRDSLARDAQPWWRAVVPRYVVLAVALVVYLVLRANAVHQSAHSWAGFVGVPSYARIFTASRVLLEYLGLFLWPRTLLADYWVADVPVARSLADPTVLLSFVAWLGLILLFATKLRRQKALLLSVAWFFITILPASNLLFAAGLGKAERILYLPSAGLCLAVGALVLALRSWGIVNRQLLAVALLLLILALGVRTLRRNEDWRDNFTLAQASLAVSPTSPIMNDLAAEQLVKRGLARQAIPMLQRSVGQSPDKALFHVHLGVAYYAEKQTDSAVAEYNKALQIEPRNADALTNLGVVDLDRGDLDAARARFSAALASAPTHTDAHIDRGLVYMSAARYDEAIQDFRAAIQSDPNIPEAHNNLGAANMRSGRLTEAAAEFRAALALRPDYASARTNLDALLKKTAPR